MTREEAHRRLAEMFAGDGIKDFVPSEFVTERSAPPPKGKLHRLALIARVCQDLRTASGARVNVTNAYRDIAHNQRVGGSKHSQHMECTAADIVARAWSPKEVWVWANEHPWADLLGIGRYRSFTHIDVRGFFPHTPGAQQSPAPARWDKRERDIS